VSIITAFIITQPEDPEFLAFFRAEPRFTGKSIPEILKIIVEFTGKEVKIIVWDWRFNQYLILVIDEGIGKAFCFSIKDMMELFTIGKELFDEYGECKVLADIDASSIKKRLLKIIS